MTTRFSYTEDLPTDPKEVKRGFYKLPRSILLPPYLSVNPYFVEYTDSMDQVFDGPVESSLYALENIRNMWAASKNTEVTISKGEMIDFTNWGGPDHSTVVQQVNLLGLRLSTADLVNEVSYRALAKFIGSYWFEKGKQSSIDFLNYCLSANFKITPLWTKDYQTFWPEPTDGSPKITDPNRTPLSYYYPTYQHGKVGGWKGAYLSGVGQPLTQANTPTDPLDSPWFPTTHVTITIPYADANISPITVGNFFYEICNYNLVLYNVDTLYSPVSAANIDGVAAVASGNVTLSASTDYYPLQYHGTVGGWTGGVGKALFQVNTNPL